MLDGVTGLLLLVPVFAACAGYSWVVWTWRVTVDDQGIRWKDGGERHALRWDEIKALALAGKKLALVERATPRTHELPFVTARLYGALKERLGPSPPRRRNGSCTVLDSYVSFCKVYV